MSESKSHQFRPPLYHKESEKKGNRNGVDGGSEAQGWDAYRKWLSSMNGRPTSRRAPIDHSVYSWKGYNNWAERVRQALKSEDT